MRFPRVKNLILSTYDTNNILNWEQDFSSIINNWSRRTADAIDFLEVTGSLNNFGWNWIVWILMSDMFIYTSYSNCKQRSDEYFFALPKKIIYFYENKNILEHINDYGVINGDFEFYNFSEVEIGEIPLCKL